ncbi:MAG: prenyltransferase [Pseudomonadota bacterium]
MPSEPDITLLDRPAALRWLLATRPAFLLLAIVAAGIGLAASARDGGIDALTAGLTLLGAVLFHAAVNVDNDYFDARNGSDAANTRRLFPFTGGSRMIQNGVLTPPQTRRLALGLYASTTIVGLALVVMTGPALLLLGLLGVALGWAYSAPPLALAGRGVGEITVGTGFGLLIPLGADLVQRGTLAADAVWAGAGFAAMATAILLINEFPDREADRQAGKRNLIVRLGPRRGRWLYAVALLLAALLPLALVLGNRVPATTLLCLAALIPALPALVGVWRYAERPERLTPAIGATITAALGYGVLTILGLSIG